MEWIGQGPDLEARLDEGFCLEESGWKGDGGTVSEFAMKSVRRFA